jgi:hypothetical protein
MSSMPSTVSFTDGDCERRLVAALGAIPFEFLDVLVTAIEYERW